MPTGSPETPGNPAIVAPSYVNRQFAGIEVAVGGGARDPVSADWRTNSLILRNIQGSYATTCPPGRHMRT